MALRRKIQFNKTFFQEENWQPVAELLQDYRCPRLQALVEAHYSKLGAIAAPGGVVTKPLCRALLTDEGLLFAQTRENGYPPPYSRRWFETTHRLDLALGQMSLTGATEAMDDEAAKQTLLDLAGRVWKDNPDTREQTMPLIRECLEHIIDRCGSIEAFSHVKIENIDGLHYLIKATGREPPYAVQVEMETSEGRGMYTCAVEPRNCAVILPAGETFCLREVQAALTPNELRVFLVNVLLRCTEQAGEMVSAREKLGLVYRQMVAKSQSACMEQQIRDYRKEDLSAWRSAQEVLGDVCAPDIERYHARRLSQYQRGPTKCLENDLADCLQKYIRTQRLTEKTEMQEGQAARLADYFTRVFIKGKDGKRTFSPAFLDQPWVIFQLVRIPPFHRLFEEGQAQMIPQAVRMSCVDLPLPFLEGWRLEHDRKLYFSILKICRRGCEMLNVHFPYEVWKSLWPCIEQSSRCVQFRPEDLLTLPSVFGVTARNTKRRAPHSKKRDLDKYFGEAMDQWIYETLHTEFPYFAPQLWRGLYNSILGAKCKHNRSCAEQFIHDFIDPYEKLFIDPAADEADVIQLVQGINGRFEWNKFPYIPTEVALTKYLEDGGIRVVQTKLQEELNKSIADGGETNVVYSVEVKAFLSRFKDSASDFGKAKRKGPLATNDIRTAIMEWALLQMTCARAQMKLIGYIARALDREKR